MRKHVDKNVPFVPPDHVNTNLSGGLGVVVETMMAKNRENRYRNPDDLILDLKCLLQGESPMIAGQKPETLAVLAEGDIDEVIRHATEAQMVEVAGLRQQPQPRHRRAGRDARRSRSSPTSCS